MDRVLPLAAQVVADGKGCRVAQLIGRYDDVVIAVHLDRVGDKYTL